jgi:hypothetical protein
MTARVTAASVAVFVCWHDRSWPYFPVARCARGWVLRCRERQVSAPNWYYTKLLYAISLTGGSRPNPEVRNYRRNVTKVLEAVIGFFPVTRSPYRASDSFVTLAPQCWGRR